MVFCFEATGARPVPEGAPTSWIVSAALYLPGVNNSRAVKVEPTSTGGPAVTLLAANEVAWRRKLDDEGAATHTKLIRGRPVKFDACDELVLCPPGTVEPPETADVAYFLLENEDAVTPPQLAGPPQPVASFMPLPTPPVPVHTQQLPAASAPHPAPLLLCAPGVSSSTAHTPNGAEPPAPSMDTSHDNPPNTGTSSVPMDVDPAQGDRGHGAYEQQVLTDNATPVGQQAQQPGAEQKVDHVEIHAIKHLDESPANKQGHDQKDQKHQQHEQHHDQGQQEQQLHREPHTPAPGANPAIKEEQVQQEEGQPPQPQPQPQPQQAPVSTVGPTQGRILQECKEVIGGVRDLLFPPREGGPVDGAGAAQRPPSRLAGSGLSAVWAGELEELLRRCDMPRTLIGVLGNTGAGKSSLLNVLLQEEDILPTNGMRASTSCPIEVSYRPEKTYHATIEFMSKAEWHDYVRKLLEDMEDNDGCIKPSTAQQLGESEAAASQGLLEAVYGREQVRGMPHEPNRAFAHLQSIRNEVTSCMDRGSIEVRERDKKRFRTAVGKYVDSSNKASAVQAWPVVKVCKISYKWPILSGGAVLVDLPGVRDANEARGAVAEAYMRRLHSVWVVADITRAVDDKTAKDLLGSSFKQRMMMDGHMDAITFVCTKSDNVHPSGVLTDLGVEEVARRTGYTEEKVRSLERQILDLKEEEEASADDKKRANKKVASTGAKCIRLYDEARFVQRRLRECEGRAGGGLGGPVADAAAQLNLPKKLRKAWLKAAGDRREEEDADEQEDGGSSDDGSEGEDVEELSDGEEIDDSDEEDDDPDASADEEQEEAGSDDSDYVEDTEDEEEEGGKQRRRKNNKRKRKGPGGGQPAKGTQAKIAKMDPDQLRAAFLSAVAKFRQSSQEYLSAAAVHKMVAKRLAKCRAALRGPQLELNSLCARARNDFSKERLTQQFAEGIQEMEDAAAQPHRSGPRRPAPELPVFCVSTREAHKLEGRCKKDGSPSTFKNVAHTEVPALRKHVSETADRGRVRAQAKLAHALFQFVESVAASLLNQRDEHTRHELVEEVVMSRLRALEQQLQAQVAAQRQALQAEFLDGPLVAGLDRGLQDAIARARGLAREWSIALRWSSYRAVVTRQGVFSSVAAKDQNWNRDLTLPVFRPITTLWDDIFTNRLTKMLADVQRLLLGSLDAFCAPVRQELVGRLGVEPGYLDRLHQRVKRDEALRLQSMLEAVEALVGERKKVLGSEVLEPAVRAAMAPAYCGAAQERGPGCFMRMKALVEAHVESHGAGMLMGATGQLVNGLEQLVEAVVGQLSEAATALLERTRARLAQLWDEPPSTFTDRYEAASKLHPLAERAARVCAKADPDGLYGQGQGQPLEPFALPPAEELKQRQLQRRLERQQQLRHAGAGQGQQHGQGHEDEGEEYGEYDEDEQGEGEGEDGYDGEGEGEEGDYLEEGEGCEDDEEEEGGEVEEGAAEDGSMGTQLASDDGRLREHGEEVDSGARGRGLQQEQGGRVAVRALPEMSPELQQEQREENELRWWQEDEARRVAQQRCEEQRQQETESLRSGPRQPRPVRPLTQPWAEQEPERRQRAEADRRGCP